MIYLLCVIFGMSCFMLTLKELARRKLNVAQAVITNYILAMGISLFQCDMGHIVPALGSSYWWIWGVIGGLFLVASMEVMATSTRKAGLAITTISSKVAVILPVLYACLILSEGISVLKIVAIALILGAMVLIFSDGKSINKGSILLPVLVFITMGGVKVSIKAAQHIIGIEGSPATDFPVFYLTNFGVALVASIVYYCITDRRGLSKFNRQSVIAGLLLGGFNYLTVMGIANGLRVMKTSVFYPSYDVAVVLILTLVGALVYREKQTVRKLTGIAIAVGALVLVGL